MPEMNLRRLRYFQAVFDEQSIRRAADRLETAPSIVTRQIRLLEEELGIPLFIRRARGVEPTEAARYVQAFWHRSQAQQTMLGDQLQALKGLRLGQVKLAISEGFVEILMREVVNRFSHDFPGVEISIMVLPVDEVLKEVDDEVADIGIAYNCSPHPNIRFVASAPQPVVLLTNPGHPLAQDGRANVGIAELAAYPLALMNPNYGLGRVVQMIEYREGLNFDVRVHTNSLAVLREFCAEFNGISFSSAFAVYKELMSGDLVELPVRHPMLEGAQSHIVIKKDRPFGIAATRMLERIRRDIPMFAPRQN